MTTETVTIPRQLFNDMLDWLNSGAELEYWLADHHKDEDPEVVAQAHRLNDALIEFLTTATGQGAN